MFLNNKNFLNFQNFAFQCIKKNCGAFCTFLRILVHQIHSLSYKRKNTPVTTISWETRTIFNETNRNIT